jgi:hypothetical protein
MAGRHATCVRHGQASDVGGTFRTTRDKHWTLTHPSIFWHNTLPIYNLLPCRKLLSTSLYSHYPTCTKEKKKVIERKEEFYDRTLQNDFHYPSMFSGYNSAYLHRDTMCTRTLSEIPPICNNFKRISS